jgi:hypothetical protein
MKRKSSYLPALAPTSILPLVLEQKFAPLPGMLARFVRLSNERQTLKRELCSVGESDTNPRPILREAVVLDEGSWSLFGGSSWKRMSGGLRRWASA